MTTTPAAGFANGVGGFGSPSSGSGAATYPTKYGVTRPYPSEEPKSGWNVSNFSDDISGYTLQYGVAGDYTQDTEHVRYGGVSIKTTVPASGQRAFSREFGYTIDLSNYANARLSVYIEGVANVSAIKILVYGGTNFAELTLRNPQEGWNTFTANRYEFYSNAGMDWSTVTKIRFNASAGAGGSFLVAWDDVTLFPTIGAKPAVAFTFDDGFVSALNIVAPLLQKYKAVGSSFIPATFIGTAGKMTARQILALRDKGWDIGAHGYDHTDYANLTPDQIRLDVEHTFSGFAAAGLDKPTLLAYPVGSIESFTLDRQKVVYEHFRAGRAAGSSPNKTNSALASYPFQSAAAVPAYALSSGLAAAQTQVDRALTSSAPIVFYCHDVAATTPAQGISTADLDTLLAYCASNGVAILSLSQILDRYPGICGGLW